MDGAEAAPIGAGSCIDPERYTDLEGVYIALGQLRIALDQLRIALGQLPIALDQLRIALERFGRCWRELAGC